MIRILYMSDLHLELERWRLSLPGWPGFLARHQALPKHPARGPLLDGLGAIDLVVLAGDIHTGLRGVVYGEQLAAYLGAQVVYVPGNHEFYHQYMDQLLPRFAAAATHSQGAVQVLENAVASFDIRGQRLNVLGCTLWTDYELDGDAAAAMRAAAATMNDHAYIHDQEKLFTPVDARARHRDSRLWLHKTLARLHKADPAARNVIVTHHAPSRSFLGNRIGAIGPAYGSDLLVEFAPHQPAAWIHGHTHFRHDSVEEGMRVVSAPRGYVTMDPQAVLAYRPGVIEI